MTKQRLAQVAKETLTILHSGGYRAPSGAKVSIESALSAARAGTFQLMPQEKSPAPQNEARFDTRVELRSEDVLTGAQRLTLGRKTEDVAILSFGSAKRPGGGFLSGAIAQEETLARATGLYLCLNGQEMYHHHRRSSDARYTDRLIYCPKVPVFRDASGALLERPFLASFVTAPAVNAGAMRKAARAGNELIMRRRIERVLGVMLAQGHRAIVLGAWGCGVFKNDPRMIARLFQEALQGGFRGRFEEVLFSVYDKPQSRTFRAFEACLAR